MFHVFDILNVTMTISFITGCHIGIFTLNQEGQDEGGERVDGGSASARDQETATTGSGRGGAAEKGGEEGWGGGGVREEADNTGDAAKRGRTGSARCLAIMIFFTGES